MKAVADTLAVAGSNLIERVSRRAKSRRPYRKAGDNELLALIRRLVDERPTYGYRRIRRLINRQRKANGKPPVNGKRVLRIMQANKLTLERHTGRRPGRTHDGVVIALRSNIRWCSDHFELACRNGEIVRVLFAIDACDREVMGWLATSPASPASASRSGSPFGRPGSTPKDVGRIISPFEPTFQIRSVIGAISVWKLRPITNRRSYLSLHDL